MVTRVAPTSGADGDTVNGTNTPGADLFVRASENGGTGTILVEDGSVSVPGTTRAVRAAKTSTTAANYLRADDTGGDTIALDFWVYLFTSLPTGSNAILYRALTGADAQAFSIGITTGGRVVVYNDGGTMVYNDARMTNLSTAAWYRIRIFVDNNDTNASLNVRVVRVSDGVEMGTSVGYAGAAGDGTISGISMAAANIARQRVGAAITSLNTVIDFMWVLDYEYGASTFIPAGTAHTGSGTLTGTFGPSGSGTVAKSASSAGSVTFTGSASGTVAKTGSGASSTTFTGAGTAAIARAGTGTHATTFTATGTGVVAKAATGEVSVGFATTGDAQLTATATGDLEVGLVASGAADRAVTGTGALGIGLAASSTAARAITATGDLEIGAGFSGDATISGNLTGTGELETTTTLTGSATLTTESVGDLVTGFVASGQGTVAKTGSGVLPIGADLAGATAVQRNATGALMIAVDLAGSTLIAKTATGTLAITFAAIGAATGRDITVSATLGPTRHTGTVTQRTRTATLPNTSRHGGHL